MRGNNELLGLLGDDFKVPRVVVMPDFFMDRVVDLDSDVAWFASKVSDIAGRKGGSMDGVLQADLRGGNAANVAAALLTLGAQVTPVICTSKFGLEQLRFHFRNQDIDLSHVKTFSKASVTTALEFKSSSGKANVMLRDLGSLSNFGPDDLSEEDYKLVEEADYVCVFNWAGTRQYGTRLAQKVFRRAKTKGKCKTYIAPADLLPNRDEIPGLVNMVLKDDRLDILSMNENEAVTFASFLNGGVVEQRKKMEFDELALLSAKILAKHFEARIDLHTTKWAATVTKKGAVSVPAFRVKTLRATGAGDAWDAGNLVGDANRLSDECRLTLANAVSACYLSNPKGVSPTRQELAEFLIRAKTTAEG
jgi:sugar/nucleoside kinase (ribokinase family)